MKIDRRGLIAGAAALLMLLCPVQAQNARRIALFGGGPWSPLNSSATVAWWDASYTPNLTFNSGNISAWTDRKSGNVASQGTGANQPSYSSASASDNNKAAALSNGTQFLVATGVNLPAGAGSGAIFAVGRQTNGTQVVFVGTGSTTNTNLIERSIIADTSGHLNADYGGGAKTTDAILTPISGSPAIYELTFDGTTARLFVNGSAGTTGTPALNSSGSQVDIFNLPYFASTGAQAIQQVVIMNGPVSANLRTCVEGFLDWYVGMAGANLPAGHRFKNRAPLRSDSCS